MRILIVEDDDVLAQTLGQHLIAQRYTVDLAPDGESGWDYIQMIPYDLILLDIDLPRLDGIALCKRLRYHHHEEPVLLLTARSQVASRVQGLDAGADDYLVKPYSLDELLARVRALLRRQGQGSGEPLLTWGPLCLDPSLCKLTVDEQAIALSPKEYQLMELFLRHPQQVLSSDRILDHIWGFDDIPGKDTVRTHMRRLRKKLKPVNAEGWIETVYGLGYRLKAKDSKRQDLNDRDNATPPLPEDSLSSQDALSSPVHVAPTGLNSQGADSSKKPESFASPPLALPSLASMEAVRQASLSLWPKFRPKALEHLALLKKVVASLEKTVPMDEPLRRQGERAAHKLVGTLGMFGMPDGSELAGQMEELLRQLCAPLTSDLAMATSLVGQLRFKCDALHHLLEGEEEAIRMLGIDESTGLLSYPQARRDITKYFCLAHRHHHAIAFVWVQFMPSHSLNDSNVVVSDVSLLLLNWALSMKQSLREEDIVTQSTDKTVLFVLYACSKENALRRLNPFLKNLSEQLEKKLYEGSLGIDPCPNILPSSIFLFSNFAEFPKDGQTLEGLKAVAFQSNAYLEPIDILKATP